MRVALITDTHFGARGDHPVFNEFFFKFWEKTFFPYLEENKITTVVHLGDIVDRRRFINFTTLHNLRKRFIHKLVDMGIDFHVIVGNHDVPYRNTNEVNAMDELFGFHPDINVYSEPTTLTFGTTDIALIPWINHANLTDAMEFIDETPAQICFGHFEISGFEMDKGLMCKEGLDRKLFNKFDIVYSGHFHHKSTDGNITYLGNTYQMTWADYEDDRGFHIFDTSTRELTFVKNPNVMFHKIVYDDTSETIRSINEKDYSVYSERMVKVVVLNKTNPILYDLFLDNLYKAAPLDISIVEDFSQYGEYTASDDDIDQADDTMAILDKYIDTLDLEINKDKLKNIIREIYVEAHSPSEE